MSKVKDEITMEDVVKESNKIRRGQMVVGTVYQVEDNYIIVTLENNQEAKMYLDYYGKSIDSFKDELKEGDQIKAIVSKIVDDGEVSSIFLDRKNIVRNENYEKIEEIYKKEEIIEAKITKVASNGLHLDVFGFSVFLPYGLLDNELIEKKEELQDQVLKIHLVEVKPGRRPRIIASRKKIFEERRAKEREEFQRNRTAEFDSIKTGDVLTGKVEKIRKHMALIRFDYVVGRLRISQISHTRIDDIKDVLNIGDEVTVKVIKKDKSLDLSMKSLLPTPIETFVKSYKKGDAVTGVVVQKLPFGIIIELAERVRGLLHRSEYSWNPDDNFQSYVKIGDKVETVITLLDEKRNKIGLSRRLLLDNPWENVSFQRGEIVDCKVIEVTNEGLTVETKGVNGVIPLKELSKERVDNPENLFAEGDEVKALVITVNPKNWYLRLSIKALEIKKEKDAYEKFLVEDDPTSTSVGELLAEMLEDEEEE